MAEPDDKPAEEEPKVNVRGEITLPLGGEDYGLRPSRTAIEAIEEKVRPLAGLVAEAGRGDLGLKDMATIAAELMKAYGAAHPELPNVQTYREASVDRLKDLIHEAGQVRILTRISVVLIGAINGGFTAAGEMKPTETTS